MCQLSICIGILIAQAVSIPLSEPITGLWRYMPAVSVGVAVLQIVTVGMVKEDGGAEDSMIYDVLEAERGAFGREMDSSDDEDVPRGRSPLRGQPTGNMTLGEVWKSKDPLVKHGLKVAVLSQFFQQMTGINSVSRGESRKYCESSAC